jgi:RNA-directed DNA polymerase
MTIKDRVMATIIAFTLNAKWEALFEPNIMGFRLGRCTQDAVQKIYSELVKGERIVLDADINKFFDNIKHEVILNKTVEFRRILQRCFNAGIIEYGKKRKMMMGVIQGNPLSPILANIALNGMQKALGNEVQVVLYADDFLVIAPNKDLMRQIVPRLAKFLKKRGLFLKREKTQITNKRLGFNFLGFRIEQPRKKLYIKPQTEKVKKFLDRIREVIWINKQVSQRKLISMLNPIIRGWAMYYRYSDAAETFHRTDYDIVNLVWRWAKRRHKQKGKRWIFERYFERWERDKWVFRDVKTGYSLLRVSDVKRLEYDFVVDGLSPLDPDPGVRKAWERRAYQKIRHAMI